MSIVTGLSTADEDPAVDRALRSRPPYWPAYDSAAHWLSAVTGCQLSEPPSDLSASPDFASVSATVWVPGWGSATATIAGRMIRSPMR